MKKIISALLASIMCVSLCIPNNFTYAETVENDFSEFINYDLNDTDLLSETEDSTENNFEYCQEYFYQQLDSTNKYCYEKFLENWSKPTDTALTLSIQPIEYTVVSSSKNENWSDEEIKNIEKLAMKTFSSGLTALLLDYPEIFWIDTKNIQFAYGYTLRRTLSGERHLYITDIKIQPSIPLNYTEGESDSELENALTAYDNFNETLENIEIAGSNDYEKIKSIYYYIASSSTYNSKSEYNPSSAGSVLLEPHYAVCEGYAHAFKLLCDRENIPCVTVAGNYEASTNSGHAWNEVYIDGNWYGADITWDDTDSDDILTYKYLCKGSKSFSKYHTPGSVYMFMDFVYPDLTEDDYSEQAETTEPTTEIISETSTSISETSYETTSETESTSETIITIIYGDVNCDNSITISDAVLLNKYLVNSASLSENQLKNSDAFSDDKINSSDTLAILKYIVGSVDFLPITE